MNWEFSILYAIQELHNPILDQIMIFFTTLGENGWFWIGVGIVCLVLKKHRKMGLQVLMSMLFTFIIGNLILKNLFQRERPCAIDPSVELLIPYPSEFSFPSGHTMNGFTAATTLFLYNKRLGIPALILAGIIAFSRLYLFVHFPTDIIGGFCVGLGVAIVVDYVFFKIKSRRTKNSR